MGLRMSWLHSAFQAWIITSELFRCEPQGNSAVALYMNHSSFVEQLIVLTAISFSIRLRIHSLYSLISSEKRTFCQTQFLYIPTAATFGMYARTTRTHVFQSNWTRKPAPSITHITPPAPKNTYKIWWKIIACHYIICSNFIDFLDDFVSIEYLKLIGRNNKMLHSFSFHIYFMSSRPHCGNFVRLRPQLQRTSINQIRKLSVPNRMPSNSHSIADKHCTHTQTLTLTYTIWLNGLNIRRARMVLMIGNAGAFIFGLVCCVVLCCYCICHILYHTLRIMAHTNCIAIQAHTF